MVAILFCLAVYARHCGCIQKSMLLFLLLLTGSSLELLPGRLVFFSLFFLPVLPAWPFPEIMFLFLEFPM